MSETCRGVLIQYTKDKQYIELVIIHIILVKIPASSRHTSFALKKAAKDFEKPVSF
jgi:hypothetical protein